MRGRVLVRVLALLAATLVVLAGLVAWLNFRDADDAGHAEAASGAVQAVTGSAIVRGEYLVRAGSCLGCHTDRGGTPYAGGRAIETPFGIVHSTNLTPDRASGLGDWSAADFWRAMHNGRSRDGRLLYPVFPYPNYTRVARADSDAMFAFLQSLAPVAQPRKAHQLQFPFGLQPALAVWRALFFRPASFEADPTRSPQWNRGAYLVETLGHCNACHSRRNVFGATAGPLTSPAG
jgi:mono/diheme cytochrome c family protein